MAADHDYVWRAVVTSPYANGVLHTEYCGPFARRNHATTAAQRAAGESSTITIQRTRLDWEDVDTRTGA